MNSFCEKLRIARESRGFSLEDLVAKTRIQRKFLEAVEEGKFSILPQIYIRAFIRSYAKALGLNEDDMVREYDEMFPGPPVVGQVLFEKAKEEPEFSQPLHLLPIQHLIGWVSAQSRVLFLKNVPVIMGGVLITSLIVSIAVFNRRDHVSAIKEIPFAEVVKQRENAISASRVQVDAKGENSGTPSALTAGTSVQQPISPPPLILRAMTFDSVWIRIVIDGRVQREYLAPPRWNGQWKATNNFVISLGNASAVSFTLNSTALGLIGEPGRPVRNYRIQPHASQGPKKGIGRE